MQQIDGEFHCPCVGFLGADAMVHRPRHSSQHSQGEEQLLHEGYQGMLMGDEHHENDYVTLTASNGMVYRMPRNQVAQFGR